MATYLNRLKFLHNEKSLLPSFLRLPLLNSESRSHKTNIINNNIANIYILSSAQESYASVEKVCVLVLIFETQNATEPGSDCHFDERGKLIKI